MTVTKKVAGTPGVAVTQPGGDVSEAYSKIDALTAQEQDRYYGIAHIYNDGAFEVLNYFKGKRTPNQWTTFLTNMDYVNDPALSERDYLVNLKDSFQINIEYRIHDVVTIVMKLRLAHGLPRISEKVLDSCVKELGKVFLVEKHEYLDDTSKLSYPTYEPVFCIMS